jgi:pilus assembly protein CpaF
MNISEAEITPCGERKYRPLYDYQITKNTLKGDTFEIAGRFRKPETISDSLKQKLMQYGVPQDVLKQFLPKAAFK